MISGREWKYRKGWGTQWLGRGGSFDVNFVCFRYNGSTRDSQQQATLRVTPQRDSTTSAFGRGGLTVFNVSYRGRHDGLARKESRMDWPTSSDC